MHHRLRGTGVSETDFSTLQKTRQAWLKELCPFETDADPHPELALLDRDYVGRILSGIGFESGSPGISRETAAFVVETLQSTDRGRAMVLASDNELLEQAAGHPEGAEVRSPFGTIEALYPIRLRAHPIGVVWTGKMLVEGAPENQPDALASATGLSEDRIRDALRTVPTFSSDQVGGIFAMHRRLREQVEQTLAVALHAEDLSEQILQSEHTRSLGALSGGIAHHFNNLLSVILGFSSFVANRETLTAEASNALRQISEAAQKGRRLTEEILGFAHVEDEEPVLCSVHDLLSSVVSLMQSQASSSITFDLDMQAGEDAVHAPRSAMHQVIFNVLSIATESLDSGGTITIRTGNRQFDAEPESTAYLRLTVADSSGRPPPGIHTGPPHTRGEPYAPRDRRALKMASVYRLVARIGGTVSTSEAGAEQPGLEILLPLAAPREEPDETSIRSRQVPPSHIWIVDDDPIFREMCDQVLSDDGHHVTLCTSGPEMQDTWRASERKPDLLVIDFSMPECNGLELREWIQAQGASPAVILVSGFSANQPDIKKATTYRKTFFLQKPFSVPELADMVTVALGETLIGE